jgi:hypothetical protein
LSKTSIHSLTGKTKKLEEGQKPFEKSSTEGAKKGGAGKQTGPVFRAGDIRFTGQTVGFYNKETEFPTMDEAAKKKISPKKQQPVVAEKPKEEEKKKEEKQVDFVMPKFTNVKKKDAKETFSPLKETYVDKAPAGELAAQPSKEPVAREFQVAGEEEKGPKQYHGGPKPHYDYDYEKHKGAKDYKKPEKKEEEAIVKPEDDKKDGKKKKAGDKVATFATVVPSGVYFRPLSK